MQHITAPSGVCEGDLVPHFLHTFSSQVREGERLVAVFLHDNFSRPNKRSGAWMSELRY